MNILVDQMKHKKLSKVIMVLLILSMLITYLTYYFVQLYKKEPAQQLVNVKTRSTYYTPEKVAAARENVEKYAWAKSMKASAVSSAEKYIALGDEFLLKQVTTQNLPRSYAYVVKNNKHDFNCLNCGTGIKSFGNYPFLADPVKAPWKLECPSCHMKFPTNDFAAYYNSGLDENSEFKPELADRSLLKNTAYPEKGEGWGVDDGFGYVTGSYKYTFIAYYNHWWVWYGSGIIINALNSLRDAYLYTGDNRYAQAGTKLLNRIADVYPEMDTSSRSTSEGFLQSDGGNGNLGKVIGSIWETGLSRDFIKAYDAFFPAIKDVNIKRNIEESIIREVYNAVISGKIRGNNGMHQSTLALAAVVYDRMPETKEWLDFNFQSGAFSRQPPKLTGGNILSSLINDVDRDGHGNEGSPEYNRYWLSQYMEVANILDGYDLYPEADLYKNAKFVKMFSAMYPLTLSDRFSANIGDSGFTGNPVNFMYKNESIKAFEKLGDPIFAQVSYYLNGNSTAGIHGDIFTPEPEKIVQDIAEVISKKGELKLSGTNLTGFGFTGLRDWTNSEAQRDLWMYYGRNSGHGHKDTLNIGIHAYKLDLSPDLGYPETADSVNAHRSEWVTNTISHNTVVVDKAAQAIHKGVFPLHYDVSDKVKLIDVNGQQAYPRTQIYRRTTGMIKIDEDNSYMVDFFRVSGGNEHYFSFHGPEGIVSTEGLSLTPQTTGTYAGSDVAYPGNNYTYTGASSYTGSGFQWLKKVEIDHKPIQSFSVDWKAKDTWNILGKGYGAESDVHLKLTMLGEVNEVALADGIPPQNKPNNPATLRYMVAQRNGKNLSSTFVSVIEPYKGESKIASASFVELKENGKIIVSDDVKAVKIVLKNGRTDYIIYSLDSKSEYEVDNKFTFTGFFGVYSELEGKPHFAYINDGEKISDLIPSTQKGISGTVLSFTKDLSTSNEVVINIKEHVSDDELIGRYIYIKKDETRNTSYEIKSVKKRYGNVITLDIGDVSLIRSYNDVNNYSKGFIYDISEGSAFYIPLSKLYFD